MYFDQKANNKNKERPMLTKVLRYLNNFGDVVNPTHSYFGRGVP